MRKILQSASLPTLNQPFGWGQAAKNTLCYHQKTSKGGEQHAQTKSNKLRIIHLLLLAALLLLTAKLIYAQVRGGDSMGRIEWTSMQLYRNGSNYDYSYNYALRLDAKSGQMLYDCSFKATANLNDEIWRCELESVPVTREELAPLDALIQGLPLAPPKEPEPVDDDLLVCDETMEILMCVSPTIRIEASRS